MTSGRSKALTREELDVARAATRRLIAERYDGNASAAAREMGLSVATLTNFINEVRGVGAKALLAIANTLGVTFDELVGRPTVAPTALARHPDWERVVAIARDLHPEIDAAYFDAAGAWTAPTGLPDRLDVAFVADLAKLLRALSERNRARERGA